MCIPSSDNVALGSSYSDIISHNEELDAISLLGVTGGVLFFG